MVKQRTAPEIQVSKTKPWSQLIMICAGFQFFTKGLHWPTGFTKASLVTMLRPCYHDVGKQSDKIAARHLAVEKKQTQGAWWLSRMCCMAERLNDGGIGQALILCRDIIESLSGDSGRQVRHSNGMLSCAKRSLWRTSAFFHILGRFGLDLPRKQGV